MGQELLQKHVTGLAYARRCCIRRRRPILRDALAPILRGHVIAKELKVLVDLLHEVALQVLNCAVYQMGALSQLRRCRFEGIDQLCEIVLQLRHFLLVFLNSINLSLRARPQLIIQPNSKSLA